jgi:nucleoside-diphosphate-sugar epimerase
VRVLVIGGTAFIGRRTVSDLLRRGDDVTLFHRGHHPNPFGGEVHELIGDRQNPQDLSRALAGKTFDGVIDIAYDSERGTGADAIALAASEVRRFRPRYVFVSSVSVYEKSGIGVTEDAHCGGPIGSYGMNKVQAEDQLMTEHRAGHLTASIVRPSYVHGPLNPIPREAWFWDRILAGRPVILPDGGKTLMHWSAVRDVAWSLTECLTNPAAVGEAFNIAEAEPATHAEFVQRLAKVAGRTAETVPIPRSRLKEMGASTGAPHTYFGVGLDSASDETLSVDKARRLLGFRPTDPIEGLKEAFDWYSRQSARPQPDFSFERILLGR